MKSKVERAREAYVELGHMFISLSMEVNDRIVEEIESGLAEKFWQEEIHRVFWEVNHGTDEENAE